MLHVVARIGNEAVIRKMLKYNVDINADVEASGYTALHHAAKEGFVNVCKVLTDAGADSTRVTKKVLFF